MENLPIAITDWDWADYGYDTHWIQPTWFGDGGLKQEHVDKAIKILREEKSSYGINK